MEEGVEVWEPGGMGGWDRVPGGMFMCTDYLCGWPGPAGWLQPAVPG